LKILTYYAPKEDIYTALTQMSRQSLQFLRQNYKKIENDQTVKHANEKIKFVAMKSIEEHNSGVNQMLRISPKELVTVSDDCTLKFWSATTLKIESQIVTETITCIAATGGGSNKKEILVAGCHSGNLVIVSAASRTKKDCINNAHYNLIRVIVSLESLRHKYFVSADVCGIVKVWTSTFKPVAVIQIEQEAAISYNSMIEVIDMLPTNQKNSSYEDTCVIACALKS